jgi:hypothetical protein
MCGAQAHVRFGSLAAFGKFFAAAHKFFVMVRPTFGECAAVNADALLRKLLLAQKKMKCRSECEPDIR